jgi:hypothetical protein
VAVKHVGVLMMPSANPMQVGGRRMRPGSSMSTGAGAGAAELFEWCWLVLGYWGLHVVGMEAAYQTPTSTPRRKRLLESCIFTGG